MYKLTESDFKRLIGTWQTTGIVKSGQKTLELSGIDSYEWILEGNYILHKANVKMGREQSETYELIRLDHSGNAIMQHFNSKGEEGSMTGTLIQDAFTIAGKDLKFFGSINAQNSRITGKWSRYTEDKKWIEFIELELEKINPA